jgi:hypothetical protein
MTSTRPAGGSDASGSVALSGFGIKMFERSRLDPSRLDERFDVIKLQTNDSAELVCRDLALIDQPVQRSRGQAEVSCSLGGTKPLNLLICHRPSG